MERVFANIQLVAYTHTHTPTHHLTKFKLDNRTLVVSIHINVPFIYSVDSALLSFTQLCSAPVVIE